MKRDDVILVRGGGDLATGTIHRLWSAGLKVLVLEAEHPAAIRRQVSVSEAVYEGGAVVEGMRAALVKTLDEAVVVWQRGDVPVMVDPKGELIPQVRPAALVDAILAKKNLGTTRDMAPLTIALGPGFTAGVDVDFVVETKRGHSFDVECLTEIYKKRLAYVGMLGSRSRSALVRRQLIEAGTAPEKAESLHAPIGLAIKAQTAQEIALSILAEIVEVKNGRQQTEGFPPELLNALDACTGQGKAPVLVTIVSRHGSTPREVGAKMLVLPDGRSVGSVGGGIMEYRVQQLASKMQAGEAAPCQLAEYSASAKEDDAALAACGGSMNVFLQLLKEEENNEA